MKTIKVQEIPKLIKEISLIDVSENQLDVETSDYWNCITEKEYTKIINSLDKINAKGKDYFIYVWYDVSGFDYWVNGNNGDNYAQISITFDKPTIKVSQIPTLENKINKVIDKVNAIISKSHID